MTTLWVSFGDDDYAGHGLNVDGQVVIGVVWWDAHRAPSRGAEWVQVPAGYYFQVGNIVGTRLLEEADVPTAEGWERMRAHAVKAYDEWIAAQAAGSN